VIIIYNGKNVKRFSGGSEYDGEKIPGDLDKWDVLRSDPNELLQSTYGDLQKRSMTLYHTHQPSGAAINKQTDYAIGPGLVFRSQPDWSTIGKTKEWAKDWGKQFQKVVHFYFQEMNFYEKQPIMLRGAMAAGDSCLNFVRDNGTLVDLVEFGGDQIAWQESKDGYYLGIKHDDLYRRQGIKLLNGQKVDFQNANGDQNVVQFFIKQLPRQLRGYPLMYGVINLAKNDDRHTDATVQRAVMESIIMATSKTEGTDLNQLAENLVKKATENRRGGALSALTETLFGSRKISPGSVLGMRSGESWEFNDIKTPSNTFDVFKTWIVNYVSMQTGTPPEVMMSKYSTSYTAHRGALNDFEKSYMMKRRTFERHVMYPVIREIAKDAILQGLIDAPGFFDGSPIIQRAYLQGMTLGPVPGTINPLQEVTAEVKAVDAGFKLRSDGAAKYGNEWDNFIEEWGEEQEEYFQRSPEKRAEILQEQEMNQEGDSNA
jgi:hypothetical protein